MFRGIDHVEIIPTDMDRTVSFYRDVLGFDLTSRRDMDNPPMTELAYLEQNGTKIELIGVEDPDDPDLDKWSPGYRMVAIEVDDMEEALGHLADHGYEPAAGPLDLGRTVRAEIRDPDGFPVELREWRT